eukprot:CAMPEP_0205891954 /NCGR_PEP_ID=MMETSP1083-20121108/22383_1 /ASSEMBLY_ACC=CAM_ASM_000430 /TAXON_ID=97485 /ORGANISM="Prymnesium parvum, Strain Texoma1" /LENGTH=40 /DNA_ID= /DNA_START= /DNA_END= /DNA_ORIENTATION=
MVEAIFGRAAEVQGWKRLLDLHVARVELVLLRSRAPRSRL